MTAFTADFELGVNGNVVNTTDTGSLTAWDSRSTPPSYSNAVVAHGTLAAQMPATSGAGSYLSWNTPVLFGRLYWYMNQLPSANTMPFAFNNSQTMGMFVNPTGQPSSRSPGGFSSNASALSVTTWYRFEYQVVLGASGSITIKVFAGDSTTQVGTDIVSATGNMGASLSSVMFGQFVSGPAAAFRPYMDCVVANATAYPGPFPVSSTAPAVTGSTTIGSTLTCDGGSWNTNATFTLTYQWQRDVLGNTVYGNIASATSSTYTLVLLDDACNVRCVVTATGTQATNESVTANSNGILDTTAPSSGSQQGNLLLLGVG